jgi:hypothetical protein
MTQSEHEAPLTWRGVLAAFRLHGIFLRDRNGALDNCLVVETDEAREFVRSEGAFHRVLETAAASRDSLVKVSIYVEMQRK